MPLRSRSRHSLAITAAVGRAAQQGLLIADSRVLETMGNIDVVVLDKTAP